MAARGHNRSTIGCECSENTSYTWVRAETQRQVGDRWQGARGWSESRLPVKEKHVESCEKGQDWESRGRGGEKFQEMKLERKAGIFG